MGKQRCFETDCCPPHTDMVRGFLFVLLLCGCVAEEYLRFEEELEVPSTRSAARTFTNPEEDEMEYSFSPEQGPAAGNSSVRLYFHGSLSQLNSTTKNQTITYLRNLLRTTFNLTLQQANAVTFSFDAGGTPSSVVLTVVFPGSAIANPDAVATSFRDQISSFGPQLSNYMSVPFVGTTAPASPPPSPPPSSPPPGPPPAANPASDSDGSNKALYALLVLLIIPVILIIVLVVSSAEGSPRLHLLRTCATLNVRNRCSLGLPSAEDYHKDDNQNDGDDQQNQQCVKSLIGSIGIRGGVGRRWRPRWRR
eukprot:NODE_395_length_1545_cov_131.987299_g288_i0.p2 GENE.NODE_395_length_1545_cov_131.987299_g288_i0~~NODE_395_length_1545_cov_131.987299_g288_i0.p2  ORF type:complete len:308 (-),score=8.03 NODE_395_length_1545_cov_131.987299_g288_i0:595-1518(-)